MADDQTTHHVARARSGDHESMSWLMGRISPVILSLVERDWPRELNAFGDPEDIVSEAWQIAFRKLPELQRRDGRLTPVLMKFLSRVCRRRVRTWKRDHVDRRPRIASEDEEILMGTVTADTAPPTLKQVLKREVRLEVRSLIDALEEVDREIVFARGVRAEAVFDIAERMGLEANTVSQRYRRALAKLREKSPGSVFDEFNDD